MLKNKICIKKNQLHQLHQNKKFNCLNALSDDEEVSNNEKLSTVLKDMISISNRSDKIGKIVTLSILSADHSTHKIAKLLKCY